MNEDNIMQITKIATEIAIEIYEQKKEEWRRKQYEDNTKKIKRILNQYRLMEQYVKKNQDQSGEVNVILLNNNTKDNPEYIVLVKKRFDTALQIFKSACCMSSKSEEQRCYHIIFDLYLDCEEQDSCNYLRGEDKISKLAERYHINKRTVYKDIERASSILASLYFGILY